MATVVPFPASNAEGGIDDWGRDPAAVGIAGTVARLRWSIVVGGEHQLPADGPALLVCNTRPLALSPWVVAFGVGGVIDRPVRFVVP